VFENIKQLRPYFHSLREIENNVSLDIKLPASWTFGGIIDENELVNIKLQDKNERFSLISLISESSEIGYDNVFLYANKIINFNKEEEEKRSLFEEKLKELELLFKNVPIDKLRNINLINENREESRTGIGLAK
jgi:hypothetical protein